MRVNLAGDPAVILISKLLKVHTHYVVGMLHTLWSWADQQLDDGRACQLSVSIVDDICQHAGASTALETAGWLARDGAGFVIPNWNRHLGRSAKRRLQNALYQRAHRSKVGITSACNADIL